MTNEIHFHLKVMNMSVSRHEFIMKILVHRHCSHMFIFQAPVPPPGVEYPIAGNAVLHIDGKIRCLFVNKFFMSKLHS